MAVPGAKWRGKYVCVSRASPDALKVTSSAKRGALGGNRKKHQRGIKSSAKAEKLLDTQRKTFYSSLGRIRRGSEVGG